MTDPLPGYPGPALKAVWGALEAPQRVALLGHLLSDTSAEWLATTLTEEGHPVSASTIRAYRRRRSITESYNHSITEGNPQA